MHVPLLMISPQKAPPNFPPGPGPSKPRLAAWRYAPGFSASFRFLVRALHALPIVYRETLPPARSLLRLRRHRGFRSRLLESAQAALRELGLNPARHREPNSRRSTKQL